MVPPPPSLPPSPGNRSMGETKMNDRSSRSHTILTITVESRKKEEDEAVRVATLVSKHTHVHVVLLGTDLHV